MPTTIGQASAAYAESAPRAAAAYKVGVSTANWAAKASSQEAEDNWRAGLQQAFADDARRKGLVGITDAYWRERAGTLGGNVIAARMAAGKAKYEAHYGPILSQVLSTVASLPARTQSAAENIENRLKPVVRVSQSAAGKTPTV